MIMSKTATLNLRVEPETKNAAEKVLRELGMSMSTAVEIYLRQIALNEEIPFAISTAPQDKSYRVLTLKEIRDRAIPVAEQYGIKTMYLFGSYARGEATASSDIDFHIDPGEATGLKFFALQEDLEKALGKPVDLLSTDSLEESFRQEIHPDEILLYPNE